MLDANLKNQLKAYLEKVTQPFEIVASLDDGAKSRELLGLLEDITRLHCKLTAKIIARRHLPLTAPAKKPVWCLRASRWGTSSPR